MVTYPFILFACCAFFPLCVCASLIYGFYVGLFLSPKKIFTIFAQNTMKIFTECESLWPRDIYLRLKEDFSNLHELLFVRYFAFLVEFREAASKTRYEVPILQLIVCVFLIVSRIIIAVGPVLLSSLFSISGLMFTFCCYNFVVGTFTLLITKFLGPSLKILSLPFFLVAVILSVPVSLIIGIIYSLFYIVLFKGFIEPVKYFSWKCQ